MADTSMHSDPLLDAPDTDTAFKRHAARAAALIETLKTLAKSLEQAVLNLRDRGLKLEPVGLTLGVDSDAAFPGVEAQERPDDSFVVDVSTTASRKVVIGDGIPFVAPGYRVTAPGIYPLEFHAIKEGEFSMECSCNKKRVALIAFAYNEVALRPRFHVSGSSEPQDRASFDNVLRAWLNQNVTHFNFFNA